MPTERQLENLKKGRKFRANDEATRQSAAKAAHAKHRNTRLRKLATEMLTATPETTEETNGTTAENEPVDAEGDAVPEE